MKHINISRCLRVAQALKDVKNIDLAKRFGVKPQQVIRWRNSEDMSIHRVQEFASYFGMTLNDFLNLGISSDAEG